jgi:nucleotide-binding universal stress UspA family protein
VTERLGTRGFIKIESRVWYGPPAESIVEAARVQKADLIVMSSHGRTGLGRLILGSVAESVLRATETPILLIRVAGAPLVELPRAGEVREAKEVTRAAARG